MQPITMQDILNIHQALVEEFSLTDDPIFPPGPRDMGLLESAAARQSAGYQEYTRWSTIDAAAASLLYGIIHNHPFHNGNKRTALVSVLVFLDRNDKILDHIQKSDLYWLVTSVAAHSVGSDGQSSPDEEVAAIQQKLKRHLRDQSHREKVITFRQLDRLLMRFGYWLDNPHNNFIDLCGEVRVAHLLGFRQTKETKRIMHIPYPGEHSEVGKKLLKNIRRTLKLDELHGYDATAFYDERSIIDGFIAKYSSILNRLAHK